MSETCPVQPDHLILREEQAEPGAYSYPWNTTKLVAGTYFCTYLLDGAVVVKRAVKVGH